MFKQPYYGFILPLLLVATIVSASDFLSSDGAYFSVGFGKSQLNRTSMFTRIAPDFLDVQYKRGTHVKAALGYQSNPIRYELELTRLNARYQNATSHLPLPLATNPFQAGRTRLLSTMANVMYDFQTNHWMVPYLGTGVGLAHIENQIAFKSTHGLSKVKSNHKAFAYQAIGGIKFCLTQQAALLFDYRYFSTAHIKTMAKRLQNHSLNIGLLYRF